MGEWLEQYGSNKKNDFVISAHASHSKPLENLKFLLFQWKIDTQIPSMVCDA